MGVFGVVIYIQNVPDKWKTIAAVAAVLWKKQNKCLSLWNTLNNDFSIQIQDVFNTSLKILA